MLENLRKYMKVVERDAIAQVSVNCVIFGFHERKLKVIVNKIDLGNETMCVLPGGYVGQKEDLTRAVERVVRESTGLEKILFKQFEVFGNASRSFRNEFPSLKKSLSNDDDRLVEWASQRFISICYLAVVDFNRIKLNPTQFLDAAQWLAVDEGSKLAMDHHAILESARQALIRDLPYAPIASNLLPAKFTLPDLKALIEAIIGRTIDRPNFRRKILGSDVIVKVGRDVKGKRRPADLYSFKHGKRTTFADEYKFGF